MNENGYAKSQNGTSLEPEGDKISFSFLNPWESHHVFFWVTLHPASCFLSFKLCYYYFIIVYFSYWSTHCNFGCWELRRWYEWRGHHSPLLRCWFYREWEREILRVRVNQLKEEGSCNSHPNPPLPYNMLGS